MTDAENMIQDTTPAYLRGGSALKKPPRRGRRAWPLEIFFATACAYFSALIYFNKTPADALFILFCLLAFFTGAFIELKTGRRFSVFGYPAVVLAFRFSFYAFFGVFSAGFWNILSAALVLGIYFGLRAISRNGAGAAAAVVVFGLAMPAGLAMYQMSFNWEGNCEEETDDLLSYGGTLLNNLDAFALTCDTDGHSLFVSVPRDKTISKIHCLETPEVFTLERRDFTYVMDMEPEGDRLVTLLAQRRELAYYTTRPMDLVRSLSTDRVHCDHPIATAKDQTRNNTLILCRENGRIIFGDLASRSVAMKLDDVASMPSGMAISNYMERAYVTDLFGSAVRIVDLDSRYPVGGIETGFSSAGIVASPDGKTLYVGRPLTGRIEAYNAARHLRKRFRFVLRGVDILKMDANGRYIFAAARTRGTVAVWDLSQEVIYGPYKIGKPINDIAFCPVSNRLYISTPCAVRYLNILMLE